MLVRHKHGCDRRARQILAEIANTIGRWEGHRAVPMTRGDRYRQNAEDSQHQAKRAIKPGDKAEWLRLAEEWLRLAREADELDAKRRDG